MSIVDCQFPIAPLHVRSGYSLLRGTCLPETLVEAARRLGHTHLALTDVNSLCGATQFYKAGLEAGLSPIIGAQLRHGSASLVALVAGQAGYENLCRIITRIHRDGRFAFEKDLVELSEGLHFVIEDASPVSCRLASSLSREQLWVGVDPLTQKHSYVRDLVRFAGERDLTLVATGAAMFLTPEDYDVARLLAAIRLGDTFDNVRAGELPHERAFLRGPGDIRRELAELPGALAGNRRLAEQCAAFKLLPRRPVFPRFPCPDGLSAAAHLNRLCHRAVSGRYGLSRPRALEGRLARELNLIEAKGFSAYFLVVRDIVQYARRRGAPVAGRGSGASSLVAYLLGITNVCPLKYDIPFERFLNEQRRDFPDLDLDFCWRIRDDIIDYAFRRWGAEHVAMVCTHNTFQARSALRETAKAFGFSNDQISQMDAAAEGDQPRFQRIADLSRRIEHLPHNLSVHPGGIVISQKPIDHYVPIQTAAKGVAVAQYDKDGVEDIGLVKLDLLGNRALSTIRHARDLIHRRHGRWIDVESLPPAEPATIRTLAGADTVGCNQLESPAMRHLLRAIRPKELRDVMKALALIRPGAASIGMKDAFIRRQLGLETVPGGNAEVSEILAGTSGVMLYEDDVMLVAAALLGESLPAGDRFRRAIQKCSSDARRLELSREFLSRCRANGVGCAYAKSIWVQMAKFNAYSFCRAHAASYAQLAYALAYLKTHFGLEFWVAALNNNQSMYHPRVYVEQAKRGGIRFLAPDVNRSGREFCPDGDSIRVGLDRISGLGLAGIEAILEARGAGEFDSLSDCLRRTGLNCDEARAMVLCGAFDSFGRRRPELMMELNLFFSGGAGGRRPDPVLLPARATVPDGPGDYSDARKYVDERKILGISVREHLVALFRPSLSPLVDCDSRDLGRRVGRRVKIAGLVEAQRMTRRRDGRRMMFLTFDDEYGLFEVVMFAGRAGPVRALTRYGPHIISGTVQEQYGTVTISAANVSVPDKSRFDKSFLAATS
ncbi:MAG: DNA polymerase III subunit alpha [Phycisphaerae bacterium]|nr:DNA polymerase III subunit alpha [Phycisphaerae bacterium]